MIKNLRKRIEDLENKIEGIVEDIYEGVDTIDCNVRAIYRLLNEVQDHRDYVENNLDNLLREQRNLGLLESALNSMELVDGMIEDATEDTTEEEESEEDEEGEDPLEDFEDTCDVCETMVCENCLKVISGDVVYTNELGETFCCEECLKEYESEDLPEEELEHYICTECGETFACVDNGEVVELCPHCSAKKIEDLESAEVEETPTEEEDNGNIEDLPSKKEFKRFFFKKMNKFVEEEETTEE